MRIHNRIDLLCSTLHFTSVFPLTLFFHRSNTYLYHILYVNFFSFLFSFSFYNSCENMDTKQQAESVISIKDDIVKNYDTVDRSSGSSVIMNEEKFKTIEKRLVRKLDLR